MAELRLLCLRHGPRSPCHYRVLHSGHGSESHPRHDLQLSVSSGLERAENSGAAAGIDLDSDELIELSEHKNCFGVKLTCAMIGKGHRLAAHVQSKEYLRAHGSRLQAISEAGFQVLSGFAESLLPALISRHTGCITGTGNVFPKTVRRLYDQAVSGLKGDDVALTEAIALQDRSALAQIEKLMSVARSEFVLTKASIQGTKYAMDHFVEKGAGGVARLPLGVLTDALREMVENDLKEDWEFESTL